MVVPLADATTVLGDPADPIHLLGVPARAIESVVLGVRSTSGLQHDIKALLAAPSPLAHVQLHRASIDDARGGLALSRSD